VGFGGRAPSDVFPSPAYEAGAELLAGVVAALAAATTPMARQAQAATDDGYGQQPYVVAEILRVTAADG